MRGLKAMGSNQVNDKSSELNKKPAEKPTDGAGFAMPKSHKKSNQTGTDKQAQSTATPENPLTPDPAKEEKSANSTALWALIAGIAVFGYHAGIAIIQPDRVTIWWYLAILPIILGIAGLKSKQNKWLAIAGIVLGVLAILVAILLFTTIYELS